MSLRKYKKQPTALAADFADGKDSSQTAVTTHSVNFTEAYYGHIQKNKISVNLQICGERLPCIALGIWRAWFFWPRT
jgi:hypothetical protein